MTVRVEGLMACVAVLLAGCCPAPAWAELDTRPPDRRETCIEAKLAALWPGWREDCTPFGVYATWYPERHCDGADGCFWWGACMGHSESVIVWRGVNARIYAHELVHYQLRCSREDADPNHEADEWDLVNRISEGDCL